MEKYRIKNINAFIVQDDYIDGEIGNTELYNDEMEIDYFINKEYDSIYELFDSINSEYKIFSYDNSFFIDNKLIFNTSLNEKFEIPSEEDWKKFRDGKTLFYELTLHIEIEKVNTDLEEDFKKFGITKGYGSN